MSEMRAFDIPHYAEGVIDTAHAENQSGLGNLLFVGDIMLGRGVETLIGTHDGSYPFEGVTTLLSQPDITMGNFEAAVPKEHIQTPNMDMKLSVKQQYLAELAASGIDLLSLANNHALDFGEDAWKNTIRSCSFYHLTCFGHTTKLSPYSVTYQDIGNERVGILALNTIGTTVDDITLGALLAKMSFYSDLQIVYVHWGEEYKDISTKTQRSLAHTLIDNGVDVIIGDHPHVVEDIELYKGKPIFYSLGNFVFDQYFSDAVQQGLAVKMTIFRDSVRYDFMGVSSLGSKSQPHVMTVPEKQQFLQAVARKSDTALDTEIAGGHIVVSR